MGKSQTPEIRLMLHQTIVRDPGFHLRELGRIVEMVPSHAKYHLDRLEKAGKVSVIKDGRHLRYYPRDPLGEGGRTDFLSKTEKRLLGILRKLSTRTIIEYILAHPGIRHGQISSGLKRSPSTVTHHLKTLLSLSVVEQTESKGFIIAHGDQVRKLLVEYPLKKPGLLLSLVDNFKEVWDDLHQ